jgi:serine/threonine protein kinase
VIGDVISGKYEVLAVLGRGGMSDVYLAVMRGPAGYAKLVVLKELRSELVQDPDHLAMFFAEARLGARLSHPAVVQVYELGQDAGRLFITMEFLEGQPLHRVLARLGDSGGLPTATYLRVVEEVLSALHYSHELTDYDGTPLHVVHRDVSPHNVFVTYDGRVKLVDFGIAKGLDSPLDTRNGIVKGKVAYMSPEQAAGRPVDRRSDVYSAGIMIWEAITGVRLWRGLNEVAIVGQLMGGNVPAPHTIRPDVPPELEAVCLRALSREPADRHQTAEALRLDLEAAVLKLGMRAPLAPLGELVSRSFSAERAEMRERISLKLRGPGAQDGATPRVGWTDAARSASTPFEFGTSTRTLTEGRLGVDSREVPTVPPPALTRRRRSLRLVGLAGAAAVALGVLAVWLESNRPAPVATERAPNPQALVFEQRAAAAPAAAVGHGCGNPHKPVVELAGDIERDAELSCDKEYLLKFNVFVKSGVTLTIEKGTTIFGDFDTKAALVVQPGGRILAEGTAEAPVVFTSEHKPGERKPGDWGGVIILGNAPTNLADDTGKPRKGKVEGITSGGEFGGTNEDDDSGVLRYVRIEYAGMELAPGNEINGLTLAGVGRKTRIDHVEIREVTDDCFEFFGGTVDAKYLVCQHGGADGFDWDLGYRGRLQFLVLQQGPHAENGSNAFEGDNDPNGSSNEPRSSPLIYNATVCGTGVESAGEQYGILARRRTAGHIANTIIAGFDAGLDVRDPSTALEVEDTVFDSSSAHAVAYPENGTTGPYSDDDDGFDETREYLDPVHRNRVASLDLGACTNPEHPVFAPRIDLAAAAPPDDGFFDPSARFSGAVRHGGDDWTRAPWIVWSAR